MIIIQFECLEIYGTLRLSVWIVKISKIMEWVQFHVALKSQPNSGDKTVFPPSNIKKKMLRKLEELVKIPNLIHSALH